LRNPQCGPDDADVIGTVLTGQDRSEENVIPMVCPKIQDVKMYRIPKCQPLDVGLILGE
jgi:hypothetical protein